MPQEMNRLGTAEEQAARAKGITLPPPVVESPPARIPAPDGIDARVEVVYSKNDGQYHVTAYLDGQKWKLVTQHQSILETAAHCWLVVCERSGWDVAMPKFDIPERMLTLEERLGV